MNSSLNRNESLLTMMPPEAQKQVLLLIKRLGDQKQMKQQFQRKCLQYEAQFAELLKQIQKLKKQNIQLKAKWQNSFSMISKVRQNFSGSKMSAEQDNSKYKDAKKLRFNKKQADWSQQSQEQNKDDQINYKGQKNGQLTNQLIQPDRNESQNKQFFKIYDQQVKINSNVQSKYQIELLPPMSGKKQRKNNFNNLNQKQIQVQNSSLSKLNTTNRSNKKIEIECLKQQIQQLTEQIKTKQTGNLSLSEKVKRCEEIRNRYRKTACTQGEATEQSRIINDSTILTSYYSPKKTQPYQKQLQRYSSDERLFQNSQIKNNNKMKDSRIQNYKQNIRTNDSVVFHNSKVQSPQIMNRSITRPIQQSFYDDGLLDLIQEMNQ